MRWKNRKGYEERLLQGPLQNEAFFQKCCCHVCGILVDFQVCTGLIVTRQKRLILFFFFVMICQSVFISSDYSALGFGACRTAAVQLVALIVLPMTSLRTVTLILLLHHHLQCLCEKKLHGFCTAARWPIRSIFSMTFKFCFKGFWGLWVFRCVAIFLAEVSKCAGRASFSCLVLADLAW